MFLAIGGLYLGVPAFALLAWTVDLWAKSFDYPMEQRLARIFLVCAAMAGMAGFVVLASFAMERATGLAVVSSLAFLLLPPLAVMLWTLYDVDLRLVYVGALVGVAGVVGLRATATPVVLSVAVVAGLAVLGIALAGEVPSRRFRRYVDMLQRACSCCGYKQRALHELADMGPAGEAAIMEYLNSSDGHNESRVHEEWRAAKQR
jgi:hypothetical protein